MAETPNKRWIEKRLQNNLHRAKNQQHPANIKRCKAEAAMLLVVDGPERVQLALNFGGWPQRITTSGNDNSTEMMLTNANML